MLVYVLTRSMDFLAFITRLLSEDIMWLKYYCAFLNNWQCLLFFAYCVGYILIIKVVLILAAKIIRRLYLNSEMLTNLAFKFACTNPAYREGYAEGYAEGREAAYYHNRLRDEHPVAAWWGETDFNPFNWFK